MAALAFEGVTKVFPDGTEAVSHFDLDVGDGELMVLVGPSGSGKSTALRMLAGLEDATAGTIRIGTRVVNDVAPKDRDIAMVFQSYALYPHMDVGHNLGFALRMQRMQRASIGERVRRGGAAAGPLRAGRASARGPLGRAAPARGRRARDRARAAGLPHGRAAVEPRREAARGDARLPVAAAPRARHHDGLRHPRPDRGHDDGRSRRRHARWAPRAVRRPADALQPPGRPVRGRLHGLARHEPRARSTRAHRRRALPGARLPAHARAGPAPRCRARPRRRPGRGRDPARGDVPRTPRPERRPGDRGDRGARRVAGLRPAGPRRRSTCRRCSPRTSSTWRARLADTRLSSRRPRGSPRAWPPDVPVAEGDRVRLPSTSSTCTSSIPTRRSPSR